VALACQYSPAARPGRGYSRCMTVRPRSSSSSLTGARWVTVAWRASISIRTSINPPGGTGPEPPSARPTWIFACPVRSGPRMERTASLICSSEPPRAAARAARPLASASNCSVTNKSPSPTIPKTTIRNTGRAKYSNSIVTNPRRGVRLTREEGRRASMGRRTLLLILLWFRLHQLEFDAEEPQQDDRRGYRQREGERGLHLPAFGCRGLAGRPILVLGTAH